MNGHIAILGLAGTLWIEQSSLFYVFLAESRHSWCVPARSTHQQSTKHWHHKLTHSRQKIKWCIRCIQLARQPSVRADHCKDSPKAQRRYYCQDWKPQKLSFTSSCVAITDRFSYAKTIPKSQGDLDQSIVIDHAAKFQHNCTSYYFHRIENLVWLHGPNFLLKTHPCQTLPVIKKVDWMNYNRFNVSWNASISYTFSRSIECSTGWIYDRRKHSLHPTHSGRHRWVRENFGKVHFQQNEISLRMKAVCKPPI